MNKLVLEIILDQYKNIVMIIQLPGSILSAFVWLYTFFEVIHMYDLLHLLHVTC